MRLTNLKLVGLLAAATIGAALLAQPAHALSIVSSLYCNPTAGSTADVDTGDVSLTINSTLYSASNCYGQYAQNQGNLSNLLSDFNSIFGSTGTFLGLAQSANGSDPNGLGGGLTFSVTATAGVSGSWTVTWTDSNTTTAPNLPIAVDLGVVLTGGSQAAAFLLPSVTLPVSPNSGTGTFVIDFLNNGGQTPAISDFTLVGRVDGPTTDCTECAPPPAVPEPATLAILGTGMMAVAIVRRRRSGRP
jgi:hypothetical protein